MKKRYLPLAFMISTALVACGTNDGTSVDTSSVKESIDYGTPSLSNENYVHIFGRHEFKSNGDLYMSFTGCGIEFKVDVKEETNSISISLSNALNGYDEQFLDVIIDGELVERSRLVSSTTNVEVASDLSIGVHLIRVIKANEVNSTTVTLKDLTLVGCDYTLLEKEYEKRVEFYGDSITCGYGVLGTTAEGFKTSTEDAYYGYPYMTADQLGYDYSVVSRSGISLAMNAFNSEYYFRHLYPTVDGINEFGVEGYKVDVAVINLGTNDNTKFNTFDSNTQLTKVEEFYNQYKDLAQNIKDANPDCKFVLCYNMMTNFNAYLVTALEGVCNYLNAEYDECAYMQEFTIDYGGSDGHPGKTAHERNANILSEFIEGIMEE
ncbi:MAG: GDSL-type esterase/lipase family protein [Bacilli bacterium]|nr:GDSL-type esterase/lipase family protein [Bacilli bacterium]